MPSPSGGSLVPTPSAPASDIRVIRVIRIIKWFRVTMIVRLS